MDGDFDITAYECMKIAKGAINTESIRLATSPDVRVTLAESPTDVAMAFAIRGSVFLSEKGCRYRDEFDSNDHCCSHLLVWVGEEPVGTLRLRWFADFSRFERMAIRPEFRSLRTFRALVRFAMKLCAIKGYRHVIGLSRAAGVVFWQRFGGEVAGPPIDYHGEFLYPMRYRLPRSVHPALAEGAESAGLQEFEAVLSLPERSLLEHAA